MKNATFEKDLFRYYGEDGENLKKRLLRPTELTYIYIYRQVQSTKNVLLKNYYKLKLRRISRKTQIQIPSATKNW